MNTRRNIIIFSLLIIVALAGIVAAFWAAGVFVDDDEDEIEINVGIPDYVDTIINLTGNDENNLVPIGTLANSPVGSVEFVVIPLNIIWTEPDNNHAEGLKGLFTIEPTVTIVHNVSLINETYLESAIELVNIYFVKGDAINLSSISSALNLVEGSNTNTYINTLNKFDANVSTGSFELELTIEIPAVVYLVAFIGIPNINTFSYIHESEIYINLKTFANDGQTYPIPIIPKVTPGFRYITAGYHHVLAIDHEGYLWGWGENDYGQVGIPAGGNVLNPVKIPTLEGVKIVSVAAGWYHSIALDSEGNLWGWGYNTYGQLGIGIATTDKHLPTKVKPLVEFVEVFAGVTTSFAIDINGDIWGWGDNGSYELGLGSSDWANKSEPTLMTGSIYVGFVHVTSASTHTLALDENGYIWGWGTCSYGTHGMGVQGQNMLRIYVPTAIPSVANITFKAIKTGADFTVAIDSAGHLWAWGRNNSNQLGDGGTATKYTPVKIPNMPDDVEFESIAVGASYYVMAVDKDGNLWGWGYDSYGNFGDGATDLWKTPKIDDAVDINIVRIVIAYYATIILDSEYQIWSAGNNVFGQFGDGTNNNSSIFVLQPIEWD